MARSFKTVLIKDVYPFTLRCGHYLNCHQLSERSFHIGIRQLPVCARCLGIYVGLLGSLPTLALYTPPVALCVALVVPMIVDGFTQLLTSYESNNWKRLITGLLFGYAMLTLCVAVLTSLL